MQGRPRATRDLHHLADRLQYSVRFVAHVRDERRAERRGLPGELDQFLGLRKGARHVDQTEREGAGPGLEAQAHLFLASSEAPLGRVAGWRHP